MFVTDQHPIVKATKTWGRPRVEQENCIELSCRLIPVAHALVFGLILLTLSFVALIASAPNFYPDGRYEVTFMLIKLAPILFVPYMIAVATKLTVRISESGITALSALHSTTLFNRTARTWQDLHCVRVRKLASSNVILNRIKLDQQSRLGQRTAPERLVSWLGEGWSKQGFVQLDFTSGGSMPFPLAGFSSSQLELLFLALSRFADPMRLNPEVISLQRDILTGQPMQLTDAYTKMWEESLRHSFEVTNFVPLLGGDKLRNGSLTVLMLLACGGLSSVYLAKQADGRRVVIKEMSVPIDSDNGTLQKVHEMFAREAAFLSHLDHPNIVRVLDHFIERQRDYLVLEFVPGLTLRQHVQSQGPFSEAEVKQIGLQVMTVLQYLHRQDPPVIHRDLSPDNLIIRQDDRAITLIDFGAANEFVGQVTGTMIGKQCYIPPEQFRGKATPQSDIYAAGGTLHFLLTGQDPEPLTCCHPRHVNPNVSELMDEVVSSMTQPEAEKRANDLHDLQLRLKRL